MSKTAREVMTGGAECIPENASVQDAARKLADLKVGCVPICGEDDRLKGMITDRDIVVKVIAAGQDPATSSRACSSPSGSGTSACCGRG